LAFRSRRNFKNWILNFRVEHWQIRSSPSGRFGTDRFRNFPIRGNQRNAHHQRRHLCRHEGKFFNYLKLTTICCKTVSPSKFSKKKVNKNAMKPKIGDPPGNFGLTALTPQGFWQKFELPPGISTRVLLCWQLTTYNWQLTTDNWQLTTDNWQLTTYNWQQTTDNWQLTLSTSDNWQLTDENWKLVSNKWQPTNGKGFCYSYFSDSDNWQDMKRVRDRVRISWYNLKCLIMTNAMFTKDIFDIPILNEQ
jgi:hypothetical protein